jgi:hypothetical protein
MGGPRGTAQMASSGAIAGTLWSNSRFDRLRGRASPRAKQTAALTSACHISVPRALAPRRARLVVVNKFLDSARSALAVLRPTVLSQKVTVVRNADCFARIRSITPTDLGEERRHLVERREGPVGRIVGHGLRPVPRSIQMQRKPMSRAAARSRCGLAQICTTSSLVVPNSR